MDTRTAKKRHEIMAAVHSKNTGPEIAIRKLLHLLGYRFRLHNKSLAGCPDIVFPIRQKVIFVHGCFWHGHNCEKGRLPKSRLDYWKPKITTNKKRDRRNKARLKREGWEACIIWQCELRNQNLLSAKLKKFLDNQRA